MKGILRFIGLALIVGVVALGLGSERLQAPTEEFEELGKLIDLRGYFPTNVGWDYDFAGVGNEYAPFVRLTAYADGNLVQVFNDTSGARVAEVYRVGEGQIGLVQRFPEIEGDSNFIPEVDNDAQPQEIIMQRPLLVGNSWSTANRRREIVAIDNTLQVPAGVFYDVVTIKIEYDDAPNAVGYEHYAMNFGLIKSEFGTRAGDWQVISELAAMTGSREGINVGEDRD